MGDGLIQLLVIGVFVVISIMEGATRKKRRQGQALQRPDETEVDFLRSLTEGEQGQPEAAEELVPDEIWAEIAELARGGTPPIPEPAPDPEPMLRMDAGVDRVALPPAAERFEEPSRPPQVSVRAGREGDEGVAMTPFEPDSVVRTDSSDEVREEAREAITSARFHRLHSSHLADLEKDPHYAVFSGERSAMLRLFGERGGREDQLRRAVILSEILGPPVSMREPREP